MKPQEDSAPSEEEGMLKKREELKGALCRYTTNTLPYIEKVTEFFEKFSGRKYAKKEKKNTMMDIKNKLNCFLDAVEKLAVTSLCIFMENQVSHLPGEINLEYVQIVIAAARLCGPLLLEFKRDAKSFFLPKLQNVEVLKYQLDRYIQTTEKFFECLGKRFISKVYHKKTVHDQNVNWFEDSIQHVPGHINRPDEIREELQVALCHYATNTFTDIKKVTEFCEKFSKWKHAREEEMNTMMDIKKRADKISLNFSHVKQSKNKGKAFFEFMKSKVTQMTADNRHAELEKELDKVLTDTLEGLEKLDCFLDAVEKLAVTSLCIFMENQVSHLLEEIDLEYVQIVIAAARLFGPLLLEFKRDAKSFFLPKLQNVEVLKYQLDRYIQTTEKFFECLGKSFISKVCLKMKTVDDQYMDCFDSIQQMLDHINQLGEIRKDPNLRMVFLFPEESSSHFISEFSKRKPGMLEFLNELEQCAVQLDKMSKGAKISSVAGSSVGAVGGVLSIVGLALIPVTAGVSLALTMTGVGLGITSAVNSAVTTGTEIGVNQKHQKKASEVFKKFMQDVQILQKCLEEVSSQPVSGVEVNNTRVFLGLAKMATKAPTIVKGIDSLVDSASAFKVLQSKEQIIKTASAVAQEGNALRNAPRVASDIPDIGQAAVRGPLALTRSARAGFIALNALFLGMDIFFICKDSISLAKGSETEVSQFIRARAALWSSEMDSWQKIHDSLIEGMKKLDNKKKRSWIHYLPRSNK